MLLYVHFPFCRSKCTYCAFHSGPVDRGQVAAYLTALLQEIDLWGRRLKRPALSSVYLGGGTPSLLPLPALEKVIAGLRSAFTWPDGIEASIEANPESAGTAATFRSWLDLGINRLSLGIQSLDNNVLSLLGRPHSAKEALGVLDRARKAGFVNVNADLLWGLPGQKASGWLKQLAVVVSHEPSHLSCYGLTVENNTPLEGLVRQGHLVLPQDAEQSRMFLTGAEYLEEKGFLQYEISNFARMGFSCQHNLGYWHGREYLGLGPAAVSTLEGRRWENPRDLAEYARAVGNGTLDATAEVLTDAERRQELVMLRLRTTRGLRLARYREVTGRDFLKEHDRLIPLLHRRGLVKIRDGFFRLTREGMLVSNSILSSLLARD